MEKGLKPNAIKVHRAMRATFPQITTIGGVRRDALPDHPSGRALDLMIPNYKSASGKALGNEVSRWAQANAESLGHQLRDLGPAHLEHPARQGGLALHGQPRQRLRQPQEPRAHHACSQPAVPAASESTTAPGRPRGADPGIVPCES